MSIQRLNSDSKVNGYIQSLKAVDLIAYKAKTKPEIIALKVIKENLPLINRYVVEHGEVPEKNPIALAAQATVLHENKIWHKIENEGIPDYESAEKEVLQEEQLLEDKGEISNFGGGILGVVFKAGSKALEKINVKRVKANKKPILGGEKGKKLLEKIQKHAEIEDSSGNGKNPLSKYKDTDTGIFLNELAKEVEAQKTKKALKKYLPLIIVGVFIIIIFVVKYKKGK